MEKIKSVNQIRSKRLNEKKILDRLSNRNLAHILGGEDIAKDMEDYTACIAGCGCGQNACSTCNG